MLVAASTGVATYARALRVAQQALAANALLLSGGASSAPDSPQAGVSRRLRALRSVWPLGVRAAAGGGGFVREDLFRLGQAFFTAQGRLLPISVPGPPGIMHWTYPLPLRIVGWRNVYTVHDVIPLTHPDLSPIDGIRHRRLLSRIAASGDRLVAVTSSAAGAIAAVLDLPPLKVVDCSQPVTIDSEGDGVGDRGGTQLPLPAGLQPGGYLLVCGIVEPRKNISRILDAYRASGTSLPLVVAGPDGASVGHLAVMLAQAPGVIRLPYQSRASIIALMTAARALLMPSLAEGFGLPVAEAMALGTPVLTSSGGALAETAGGAALLVDPTDTAGIATAIARIAQDDALCRRLAVAGRARASAFTPQRFAQRLDALYDSLDNRT